MKKIFTILLSLYFLNCQSQITQLNSGTTVNLRNLSVIGNNILIGGITNNYISKSYDECNQLTGVASPGVSSNYQYLQRLDTNNLYLLSYGTNDAQFYKSVDGGNHWVKKLDSASVIPSCFVFFDSLAGIVDKGSIDYTLFRTSNSGTTWTTIPNPLPNADLFRAYGDSLVMMGGTGFSSGIGAGYISKDRGVTWTYAVGFGNFPTDFFFLNKDTIFGTGGPVNFANHFAKSFDGGVTWHYPEIPLYYPNGIYFKSAAEGYVVGADASGNGIILRTFDLGETWQTFNTGIITRFENIRFLSDSIALLTGTRGVIAKWNYTNTIFTALKQNTIVNASLKIVPNPIKDKFQIEYDGVLSNDMDLSIYNFLGQLIFKSKEWMQPIDISALPNGLYILILSDREHQKTFKLIKE